MNIKEALIELRAGKAIKRIGEDKIYFILRSACFDDYVIDDCEVEEFDKGKLLGSYLGTMHFSEEDVFAEDWIVYTRPRDLAPGETV